MADYFCGNDSLGNPGNDADPGTSFGARKATLGAGLALCVASGDRLIVTAPVTFPLSVTATTLGAAGTANNPYTVIGGNSLNGAVDGSIAYLNGNGTAASLILDGGAARGFWNFVNLDITGCSSHGVNFTYTGGTTPVGFINCTFHHNLGCGAFFWNDGGFFYHCTFHNNTSHGVDSRGSVIDCTIYSNGGAGISGNSWSGGVCVVRGNIIYSNTSHGISGVLAGTGVNRAGGIFSNTVNGNGGDGLRMNQDDGTGGLRIERNIFSNNTGYGVNNSSATMICLPYLNHYHNNTSGKHNNVTIPAWWTESDTSGDPLYTAAASGNFLPQMGSPVFRTDSFGGAAGAVLPIIRGGGIRPIGAWGMGV